jgi:GMP synthase (glutamine-hydrolysing)
MKILLVDNNSNLLEKLKTLIPGEEIVHRWDDLENINSEEFDLIILSGGSMFQIVGNEEKLKDEIKIIKECKKPLIGICYGCELIVESFGGELDNLPENHKGVIGISVIQDDPIFGDIKSLRVYENHKWRIKTLPECFIPLAQSEHSIEVIRHKELPIYGLQFHPENMVDETDGEEIFLNLYAKLVK